VCECNKQSADRIAEKAARVSANSLTGAPVRKYNVDTPGEVEISKTGVLNAALARLRGDRASVQLLRFVLVVVTQAIEAPMDCFALAQWYGPGMAMAMVWMALGADVYRCCAAWLMPGSSGRRTRMAPSAVRRRYCARRQPGTWSR
jgi:hypothetical protein